MYKKSPWDKAFNMTNFIFLFIATFICFYPFYYIFIYSISDPIQALKGLTFLPKGFNLLTYAKILKLNDISRAFYISVSRTVLGTGLQVLGSSFFAYLVTRDDMPFRKFVYRTVVISSYLGAGLIPYYILIKELRLRDTFLVYIIPGIVAPFFVILVKTFIESLPKSLEESAMIDGARTWQIFLNVIFPLCMPILATITVFGAVGAWNSYFDNYLFINNKKLDTLQIVLYRYMQEAQGFVNMSREDIENATPGQFRITPETVRMTITMVVTFPILFVYPFFQRYFVKGIMIGAVKG